MIYLFLVRTYASGKEEKEKNEKKNTHTQIYAHMLDDFTMIHILVSESNVSLSGIIIKILENSSSVEFNDYSRDEDIIGACAITFGFFL